MRKIAASYVLSWALGFLMMPTAYAENDSSTTTDADYRIPLYDQIEFSAEASGSGKVSMKWSAFEGYNDEKFEYYKVIRSYANPNPVYPEDDAIAYKAGLGDLRHTDNNAWKSAYYRVCAITDVKGRHCSNVIWVEVEKTEPTTECKNFSSTGECEDAQIEKEKKEQARAEWTKKQNEAKARLAEKKAKLEKQSETWEKQNKAATETKKAEASKEKAAREAELYAKLYVKLDAWLEGFGASLEASGSTNEQKIQKIEAIQKRFYEWEQGKSVRIKMVDYIDKTLNEWKEKYGVSDDFSEIDAFLDGLLD